MHISSAAATISAFVRGPALNVVDVVNMTLVGGESRSVGSVAEVRRGTGRAEAGDAHLRRRTPIVGRRAWEVLGQRRLEAAGERDERDRMFPPTDLIVTRGGRRAVCGAVAPRP